MKNSRRLSSVLLIQLLAACGAEAPASTSEPAGPALAVQAGAPAPAAPTATASAPAATASSSSAATPTAAAPASSAAAPSAGDRHVVAAAAPSGAADDSRWCGVKQTLDSNCTVCHNEQKVAGAPMSLKTYADLVAPAVSDKTKKVYEMVGVRVHDQAKPMPPQGQLEADQLSELDGWIAAGAPAGADPTCAQSALPGDSTVQEKPWPPTDCDALYKVVSHGAGGDSDPYLVPAGQELHPQVTIAAPWGDEQLQAIDFRAITDNPKVLHHWILYGPNREHILGWAPGKDSAPPLPADVGMNLPGGMLTLDMHYNNLQNDTDQRDQSGVEICAVRKEHFRAHTAAVTGALSQFLINIPAHATNFEVTGTCDVSSTEPVTLLTASPHAHTYATHMRFTLERASGEQVVMLDAPFTFQEQTSVPLPEPLVVNAGDKITTTCIYDNASNQAVTFGENTGNEMCFNFATYYPMGALNCGGGLGGLGGMSGFPGFGGR